jgi:hypothetical protein
MGNASKDNLWRLAPDASILSSRALLYLGKLGARSAPHDVAFVYITHVTRTAIVESLP